MKVYQKYVLLLIILLISACEPISTEKQYLSAPWKLRYDPERVGLRQGWFDNDYDRGEWAATSVPGYWADEEYDGFAWYTTEIQARNNPSGYNLALVFESIDDHAVVWLDGRLFGKQLGRDMKFYFDIGDKLEDGKVHQLVLRIEDTGGPGGINGAVYLEPYLEETDLLRTEVSKKQAPSAPPWVQNASLYEVSVKDYSAAGTFNALKDDLDRIKSLGVDIICLMPIQTLSCEKSEDSMDSPCVVEDYYATNPAYGTLPEFQDLVREVHAREMHIILDFILNHGSRDNPLITEHPGWYTRDGEGQIISPRKEWVNVADFNYDNPGLRHYMSNLLAWWITETNIDGYRFASAELVPNDFWAAAKIACKQIKPDVFFLAEGARPDLHLYGQDMTYSWNMWAGVVQMARGMADPSEVRRSYEMEQYQYPKGALRLRFTEEYNRGRSRALIGDDELNLTAWAFIAFMKGNPLISAGQEVNTTHESSLSENNPIDWEAGDNQLSQKMSEILQLRKNALTSSSKFQIILTDNDRQIIAYKHGPVLSFFNFSADTFKFSAAGMDSVLLGGIILGKDSTLSLLPKSFGMIE